MRLLLILLLPLATFGQSFIDAIRLPPSGSWQPGIPGGIPAAPTNIVNVKNAPYNAAGDGVTDDTTAINNALTNANSIIYLPAGTYYTSSGITFPTPASNVVLRGAGPTNTIITSSNANNIVTLSSLYGISQWQSLTADASRGATSVVVGSTANFPVGRYVVIDMANRTEDGLPGYMSKAEAQWLKVLSKTATQLNFDRQLYIGYYTNRTAQISHHASGPSSRCGVEDLQIKRLQAAGLHMLVISGSFECWVQNVWFRDSLKWNIRFDNSARCEVRYCDIRGFRNGGGDTSYGVGLFGRSSDIYVYDNIAVNQRHSYITEYGGQGNVFAYNYSRDPINENGLSTDYLMGDICHHGGMPQYNLWEGNIHAVFKFDNVLGGSRYNLGFRNWTQRKGLTNTIVANFFADIQTNNNYAALAANVYEDIPPGATAPVYRLGSNGDTPTSDTNVAYTIFLHGNYSKPGGTNEGWVAGYSTNPPSSYFLSSKPAWFGDLSWPPIGADLANRTNATPDYVLPAYERYMGRSYGYTYTNSGGSTGGGGEPGGGGGGSTNSTGRMNATLLRVGNIILR